MRHSTRLPAPRASGFTGGGSEITTQVLVESSTGTALVASAAPLVQTNTGFASGRLSLALLTEESPLLAGYAFEDGLITSSTVWRFVP